MTSGIQQRLAAMEWTSERSFVLDGLDFALADVGSPSQGPAYSILKRRSYLDAYAHGLAGLDIRNMVELGIRLGGSTVFLAVLLRPQKLLALDISKPVAALEAFRSGDPRGACIATAYRTSQDDESALSTLLAREMEGPLDLVIDDASHFYDESRSAFEILFPRLRPGGVYAIEDWQWAHTPGFWEWLDKPALSNLVFQLTMICASRPDLIASVDVRPGVAFVRRGTAEVSAERLDVVGLCWTQERPFTLL